VATRLMRPWLLPNGPELAGSAIRVPVSAETNDGHRRVLAELSPASQSRFPETEIVSGRHSDQRPGFSGTSEIAQAFTALSISDGSAAVHSEQ
jgi:hypothetical protein